LEKGSSYAAKGMLLPPWDTHATLDRLAALLRRYQPEQVVALGDSFHDRDGSHRLPASEQARLHAMTVAHRFTWVLGNHDPAPPTGMKGEWAGTLSEHPLLFRHEATIQSIPGEIAGHHHPKASIQARAGTVSRPCFVFDGRRLMMPAFGAYTGGLDVADPAIARLFPRGGRVFLLGKDRLYSFAYAGRGARVA
jgi:DNA ligase-associated metallophosphoesterase